MAAPRAESYGVSQAPDLRRWPQADDLLDQALEMDPRERDSFLERAAGADTALLDALRAVVQEASREDDFLAPGGALSGTLAREIAAAIDDSPRSLAPGTAIEHYEIVDMLGRGGMGEVYRARDNKLDRDVALKVLPDHLVRDTHRVARFRREARALASLNHSAIGAIYGVAESDGREALVLELIEGPTLAERLERGPLRLQEAIELARRLAEAIAAAHASGILHRDLKPANVKILPGGAIKILDFGLAKALDLQPGAPDADLTAQNPSFILGTAPYMSPEQMRAEPVDERSDIWAFGCVLFEMLTGTRAFHGRTPAEVMARVLGGEPAFDMLPAATPEAVRGLVRRCLERDPNLRLRSISDATAALEGSTAGAVAATGRSSLWRWAIAGAALLAIGAAVPALVSLRRHPEPPAVSRFALPLPPGDTPAAGPQPAVAFSPDGRAVVYRARRNGVVQLFRRSLGQLDAEPVPGTENGAAPFFSPDGRWLAFDSGGVLTRVSLAGGPPIVIGSMPVGLTAAWMPDDSIVFATASGRVLQRVMSTGGAPQSLTVLDEKRGDTLHLLPEVLPDGETILFTIVAGERRYVALRLASGETRIVTEGTSARYVPQGFIAFWRDGSLWGMRFDPSSKTAGRAVSTDIRVQATDATVAHFDAAADGSLVYLPPDDAEPAEHSPPRFVFVQHWVEELRARLAIRTND
jgi:eukaryotic-like serine/threonine-protein kinase